MEEEKNIFTTVFKFLVASLIEAGQKKNGILKSRGKAIKIHRTQKDEVRLCMFHHHTC